MARLKKTQANAFTTNLNRLMTEKNISVRRAADMAGVSPSTVNSWRSGSAPTDFKAIRKLAKGLRVSFEFLLTGESEIRSAEISLTEIFEEESPIFDGYARISIKRLIPRAKKENG